jgi:hypothetical protein
MTKAKSNSKPCESGPIPGTAANGAVVPWSQRASQQAADSARFIEQPAEELHKVWIYGLALGISIWALGWQGDWSLLLQPWQVAWKLWVKIPVVAVFMVPVIALAEIPFTLAAVLAWTLVKSGLARFRAWR